MQKFLTRRMNYFACVSMNLAPLTATRISQASAILKPAVTASRLMAPMTGFIGAELHFGDPVSLDVALEDVLGSGDVDAGAEGPAGPGQNYGPEVSIDGGVASCACYCGLKKRPLLQVGSCWNDQIWHLSSWDAWERGEGGGGGDVAVFAIEDGRKGQSMLSCLLRKLKLIGRC